MGRNVIPHFPLLRQEYPNTFQLTKISHVWFSNPCPGQGTALLSPSPYSSPTYEMCKYDDKLHWSSISERRKGGRDKGCHPCVIGSIADKSDDKSFLVNTAKGDPDAIKVEESIQETGEPLSPKFHVTGTLQLRTHHFYGRARIRSRWSYYRNMTVRSSGSSHSFGYGTTVVIGGWSWLGVLLYWFSEVSWPF